MRFLAILVIALLLPGSVCRAQNLPNPAGFRPLSIPNPADAGCNSDLAQYSNTPTLHHSARPDSRTRTTTRTITKPQASFREIWQNLYRRRTIMLMIFNLFQGDGQHDFDFIFGRWKVHLKRRVAGADTWTEFDGTGIYRKIWNGRANLNEFEADSPTGRIEGLTLRTYNPQTHQWSLYWVNSKDGIVATPQIGQFENGRGEFYAEDTSDGKSTFVRYVWTKISADSVHFEQSFSGDGGKTWDANWISDMVRLPDESDKAPLTAETNSTPSVANAENDGQHDFDPLFGSWKYHLKRRMHPLTGSTTWVELEGTGVCYKLWNGRAQLDTIEVDGPTGHIEGLTLRLFNPHSRQWRLYWANSKDGAVAVPQIGQFKNGHGEFYAQDELDDKSIFIRYDWTKLETDCPHFEQSFSDDGGKTWEVNWVTDQTRLCDPPSQQQ